MGDAAVAAAAGNVHGLVPALTSFVGRAGELDEVAGLLDEYRLVTVTGPGGVGKTRLAAEVARRVAGRFADGVWLVELARVQEPSLLQAAVATALGLRQAPGTLIIDSLITALTRQQILLVLDNCEHLLAAAAALCAALLPAADDVRILATSREPIGLATEVRYRLPPLGLPRPGDPAGMTESEAVLLFADRARRVDSHFILSSESGPVVARIVARLDGIPLAIELAAARAEALGVGKLLERLDDRFSLLAGGDRLAAPRQRSLEAAVDWSYQLLAEQERQAFRRLALFPGPFTLEAAEAVGGRAAGPAVLHLVNCSLLMPPQPGPDGRARYLMLETLRAYGTRRLAEAGEHADAAAALAWYALQAAEEASAGLETRTGDLAAARWLDAEDATLHQGLAWSLEHDPATALRLAVALASWWQLRGRSAAGYELLQAAAGQAGNDMESWCAAQLWLGDLAVGASDDIGLEHFTAARDALASRPPAPMLVRALNGRAACLTHLDHLSDASEDARRALAMAQGLDDPAGQALGLYWLAGLAYYAGDHPGSLALLRQAQQFDSAAIPVRTAQRCSLGLTIALTEVGDYGAAERNCSQSLAAARQAGDLLSQAESLAHLADIDLRTGRLAEARTRLGEAIDLAFRIGHYLMLSDLLDYCGHLCAARQRWAEAITIWAAYAAINQERGSPDPLPDAQRRQQPLRQARQATGTAGMRAAEERGRDMSLTAAAEFAALQIAAELQEQDAAPGLPRLSVRERELLTLVAQGRTDAQIAGQLYISVRTVRSHLDRIRDKTSCRRRADLTRLALQAGLV